MMKSRIYFYLSCCCLSLLLLPTGAFANVLINEVMYDLDGTDADREWIEVKNAGTASVDIASFKLFEANVNHSITSVQGSTVLEPGETAVIAATPTTFLADWPGFSGKLFDSSFSLSNTGELLGIRNGTESEEDTVAYASTMGAQGDGKSLGRSGTTFAPQTPSPGVSESTSQQASTQSQSNTGPTVQTTHGSAAQLRSISVHAGANRTVAVGADTLFSAQVYGLEGELASDARVVWTFGNGDTREGRVVKYAYPYPGRYLVSILGVIGEYSAETRLLVEAKPAQVALEVETDGALSVLHLGEGDLDISLWQIERAGVTFRFPARTIILEGEGIRLHSQTSGLPVAGVARLLYPNGEEATAGEMALERFTVSAGSIALPEVYAPLFVVPPQDEPPPEVLEENPPPVAAALYAANDASLSDSRTLLWFAGALSVSVLGASLVVLVRRGRIEGTAVMATEQADKEAEEYQLL